MRRLALLLFACKGSTSAPASAHVGMHVNVLSVSAAEVRAGETSQRTVYTAKSDGGAELEIDTDTGPYGMFVKIVPAAPVVDELARAWQVPAPTTTAAAIELNCSGTLCHLRQPGLAVDLQWSGNARDLWIDQLDPADNAAVIAALATGAPVVVPATPDAAPPSPHGRLPLTIAATHTDTIDGRRWTTLDLTTAHGASFTVALADAGSGLLDVRVSETERAKGAQLVQELQDALGVKVNSAAVLEQALTPLTLAGQIDTQNPHGAGWTASTWFFPGAPTTTIHFDWSIDAKLAELREADPQADGAVVASLGSALRDGLGDVSVATLDGHAPDLMFDVAAVTKHGTGRSIELRTPHNAAITIVIGPHGEITVPDVDAGAAGELHDALGVALDGDPTSTVLATHQQRHPQGGFSDGGTWDTWTWTIDGTTLTFALSTTEMKAELTK